MSSRLPLVLIVGLAYAGATACGEGPPRAVPATAGGAVARTATPEPTRAQEPEALPLPPLPEIEPARVETPRTPPSITDFASAEAALAAGFYAEVEQALPRFAAGPSADRGHLLAARVRFATGRYDEAAALALQAADHADLRIAATTLHGESLAARGRLDEAERALAPIAREASAHRARIVLARVHERRGRRDRARELYRGLIDAYNDRVIGARDAEGLSYVAIAAYGLGSVRDANDAFTEATRADRTRDETQLEWARLFLAKYDIGHAEESVREVLARNPEHPVARVLMARIRIEQSFDFDGAKAELERALRVNPALVEAHVTLAGMALRDLDFAEAESWLTRALAIDPVDLEALSVKAALPFVRGDTAGFEAARRAVTAVHPRFSRFYTILSEFAEWEHRYPDIVRFAREAIRLDPDDATAQALLGMNLLRMGDETRGLEALHAAWGRDRYNVQVFNLLNLYDDILPNEYETFEASPFVFRMSKAERPVLERYVPETLSSAYRGMVERYGFTPEGPLRIEMYASPQHFSLRTTGLPNLGVQGVCFGKVVTAISPRGGPFNWGQITWHELAHVFHIQLSNNRVPRWFTEGLAEYETRLARPEWRREMDHDLYVALRDERLPPLARMNEAFTHARSGEDMMTAYYASSEIVRYLGERFGFPSLVAMLRGFAEDLPTETVVERALGVPITTVDADFRRATLARLAPYARQFMPDLRAYLDLDARARAARERPDDAEAVAAYAAALHVHGRAEESKTAADRAIRLDARQPLALYVRARIAAASGEGTAEALLRRIIDGGHDGYELRILLARMAMQRDDAALARRELEAAVALDTARSDAWQGLLALAESSNDSALRLRALHAVADAEEHDRTSYAALIEALAERGQNDAVVVYGERARFVDPGHRPSHLHLARAYRELGRAAEALRELDVALLLGSDGAGAIELDRARALVALGRRADAEAAVRRAAEADPALATEGAGILRARPAP